MLVSGHPLILWLAGALSHWRVHLVRKKITAKLLSWKLCSIFHLATGRISKDREHVVQTRGSCFAVIQLRQFTFTVFSQLNLSDQLRAFTAERQLTIKVLSATQLPYVPSVLCCNLFSPFLSYLTPFPVASQSVLKAEDSGEELLVC